MCEYSHSDGENQQVRFAENGYWSGLQTIRSTRTSPIKDFRPLARSGLARLAPRSGFASFQHRGVNQIRRQPASCVRDFRYRHSGGIDQAATLCQQDHAHRPQRANLQSLGAIARCPLVQHDLAAGWAGKKNPHPATDHHLGRVGGVAFGPHHRAGRAGARNGIGADGGEFAFGEAVRRLGWHQVSLFVRTLPGLTQLIVRSSKFHWSGAHRAPKISR